MKHTTIIYKQVLAGLLLVLQAQTFEYMSLLGQKPDKKTIQKIARFAKEKLQITLPADFSKKSDREKTAILRKKLNRPIRICGMVKNQGEPGGGPFFTENTQGIKSLQVVETAQINRKDPEQEKILTSSTHFNPVDLVCGTKDYRGRYWGSSQKYSEL